MIHKSLVEQVTDELLDLIDENDLKPGDKLPSTAALVDAYGVSRPVVREALKLLEGQGVIQTSGGRNAVVRPVSGDVLRFFFKRVMTLEQKSYLEIVEVRYGIEVQCARLAAERRTPEQLDRLCSLVQDMQGQIDSPEVYAELDVKFHLAIARATQNTLLFHLVNSIRDALRDMIREGLAHRLTTGERKLVQIAHERIVQTIADQDGEAAAKAMAFHFDDAIRAIFE